SSVVSTETNQSSSDVSTQTSRGSSSSQRYSNSLSTGYSLVETDTTTSTSWDTHLNQLQTISSIDISTATVQTLDTGNENTGVQAWRPLAMVSGTISSIETNQGSVQINSTFPQDRSSSSQTGNTLTGTYNLADIDLLVTTSSEFDSNQAVSFLTRVSL